MHLVEHHELLTVSEAARELDVGIATIYRWVEAGKLPAVRVTSDALRIDAADVGKQKAIIEEQAKLLTLKEAARKMRVSNVTVHRIIKQGKLPVIRISEKIFRVESADVDSYLASCRE